MKIEVFYYCIIMGLITSCSTSEFRNKDENQIADSLLIRFEFIESDYELGQAAPLIKTYEDHVDDTLVVKFVVEVMFGGHLESRLAITTDNNFRLAFEIDGNSDLNRVNKGVYEFTFYILDNENRIIRAFAYDEIPKR